MVHTATLPQVYGGIDAPFIGYSRQLQQNHEVESVQHHDARQQVIKLVNLFYFHI